MVPITPQTLQPTDINNISTNGLFFASMIVRGQPIFPVGSVGKVSATQQLWLVLIMT